MTHRETEEHAAPSPSERLALSRALLSRLSDQCAALEATLAAGHQQGLALRDVNLGPEGLEAFENTVTRMAEQRDALATALARLMDAASALAGQAVPNLRAATPFLDPTYLRAWENGLTRLTSLNATLAEQQATAEIHARRGLTVLDAWRNVLGAPTDAGPTYNRYGQARGHSPDAPPRLAIKL
jgi:hypothetical protein